MKGTNTMEINEMMTIINSVGFPIFCVMMLGLYIFLMSKEQKADREKTNEIIMNFALNIQANTNALQNLSEIIKENVKKNQEEDK